jgi:hypothetical protein
MKAKNTNSTHGEIPKNGIEDTPISIAKCRKILNKNGWYYSDEEIAFILQVLPKLATISLKIK